MDRPTVTLAEPGVYQLRTPSSRRFLAVNVHPAESDLTRASDTVLGNWQQTASATRAVAETRALLNDRAADASAPPASQQTERELPLAPWLLALLAALVLIEAVYANVFRDTAFKDRTRSAQPPNAEAAA
ncbi:MAG: hypothetical protein AB7I04_02565 [Pseudomonadales bacterium]